MKIARAEEIVLDIPFYAGHVTRAMQRAMTHNERVHVYRVELGDGSVGYGDGGSGGDLERLNGINPLAVMQDDGLGQGLQMAVVDAVGRATGTPAHALIGTRLRDRCPVSWWDIDMSPADWALEAKESVARGYTCFKMKARPWWDVVEQVETVSEVVPADYRFDVDFNGFLLNSSRAEMMLQRLDEVPNVGMYESPFYLGTDLTGARILRERVRKPIVEHFREDVLHAHCSDGFVVGGGISGCRTQNALAESFNKPFWLQLVGTGLTTAFAVQLGSTLSQAQLPYITCSELWEHDLLSERLEIVDGYAAVSDAPGLGVEVDEGAIERYRVDPGAPTPTQQYRQKNRILRISWPGAGGARRTLDFTDESKYQQEFYKGSVPGFERGVGLEVIEDDGSSGFSRDHEKLVARGR